MSADLGLAEHFVAIEQPRRALEVLADAGGDLVERPDYWHLLALAHYQLDEDREAARVASIGLERDPSSTGLLCVLALARSELDELAEAERAVLAALELDPDDPTLLCAYARVLARGGQLDKAERVLDEAARLDPHDRQVVVTRSLVAYLRGHDRRARRLTEELLAADPEDAGAHRMRGAVLLSAGDARGARASLETAVRDDPTDHSLAKVARSARIAVHPLLWPMIPLERLGVAGSWVAAITIIFGLRALGLDTASAVASGTWLVLVVYSWVAVPLITRRLERAGQ